MHEASLHDRNSWVTLTYDPEHLPPAASLRVRDWQLFAKRLRRAIGPFRFFQCGEYGLKGRPHHHAVIFGHDFPDRVSTDPSPAGHPQWRSPTLELAWGNGTAVLTDLVGANAAYTAGYSLKALPKDDAFYELPEPYVDPETGEVMTHRKREFVTMSRRPGIGHDWLLRYKHDVYPHDFLVDAKGHKCRPPGYYDSKMRESSDPTDKTLFLQARKTRYANSLAHEADRTPARLKTKYNVHVAKKRRKVRDLA